MLSGLEGLQEIVGLMVMAVSVRAGTDTGWSKKFCTISLYALTL